MRRALILFCLLACNDGPTGIGTSLVGAFDIVFYKQSTYWPGDPQRRAWASDGVVVHFDLKKQTIDKWTAKATPLWGVPIDMETNVTETQVELRGTLDVCSDDGICDRWKKLVLRRAPSGLYDGTVEAAGDEISDSKALAIAGKATIEVDTSPPRVRFVEPIPRVAWEPFLVEASEPVKVSNTDAMTWSVAVGGFPGDVQARGVLHDWSNRDTLVLGPGVVDEAGNPAEPSIFEWPFLESQSTKLVSAHTPSPMWGTARVTESGCEEGQCLELATTTNCAGSSGIAARFASVKIINIRWKLRVGGPQKPYSLPEPRLFLTTADSERIGFADGLWNPSQWVASTAPYNWETPWQTRVIGIVDPQAGIIIIPPCNVTTLWATWSLLIQSVEAH